MNPRVTVAIACLLSVCVPCAANPVLEEIRERYAECMAPGFVLDVASAERLEGSLKVWKLNPVEVPAGDREMLYGMQIFAALGVGDAARAQQHLAALRGNLPDAKNLPSMAYLVACASGNAAAGQDALKSAGRGAKGELRKRISRQRRCIRQVGQLAPSVRIRTSNMGVFNPSEPSDACHVLQFWKLKDARESDPTLMKELTARFADHRNVQWIGINADDEADVDAATSYAKESGWTWPQKYEGVSRKAPLTDEAFKVGRPGWLVVVDATGYIRAVGDPDDSAIAYAIQAASAEAAQKYPRVIPTARDGSQPKSVEAVMPARKSDDDARVGGDKDDADAEAKFRQARLMLRTGRRGEAKKLLQEIVSQFPGTVQAGKAAELLEGLP